MLETLLSGWGFARFLRLFLGLYFGISAIIDKDYFVLVLSGILLYQAMANTGCGFTRGGSCSVEPPKSDKKIKF